MVLRRSGSIHRKISMNTNITRRKTKKFKERMKAKKERRGAKPKTVRIHMDDIDFVAPHMIRSRTRKNPLANVKLSNKKKNKIIKLKRYMMRDKEENEAKAASQAEAESEMMEVTPKSKKQKKDSKSVEMDCE